MKKVLVVLVLLVPLALIGLWIARNAALSVTERDDIIHTIDGFMHAMERKDVATAHSFYSPRGRMHTDLSRVEELLKEPGFSLFSEYVSCEVLEVRVLSVHDTDPAAPQGTVANVTGKILYENDMSGQFAATLELQEKAWRLYGIQIMIPAEKRVMAPPAPQAKPTTDPAAPGKAAPARQIR